MTNEFKQALIDSAKDYAKKDGGGFNLFEAEIGWEKWMEEFCFDDSSLQDGGEITEGDSKRINSFLHEIYNEAESSLNDHDEDSNEFTEEELAEAIQEFLDSCHRTDHHDLENNIRYFLRENDHMDIDEAEVREIFVRLDQ